jgi:hypothetical protein
MRYDRSERRFNKKLKLKSKQVGELVSCAVAVAQFRRLGNPQAARARPRPRPRVHVSCDNDTVTRLAAAAPGLYINTTVFIQYSFYTVIFLASIIITRTHAHTLGTRVTCESPPSLDTN